MDYTQIAIQIVTSLATVFAGAGFWTYLSQKSEKKDGISTKIDTLSADLKKVSENLDEEKKHRIAREKSDDKVRAVANDERKAIIESQKALMRERLLENAHKCIAKGFYTEQEREVYHAIYEIYVNEPYKGNGVIHTYQPILADLPLTDPNKH